MNHIWERFFTSRHLRIPVISVCLFAALILSGCVSLATDYRKEGFKMFNQGFDLLDESPKLHKVIELNNVKVHIVGNRSQFNWDVAAAYGSPVAAYANTKNEIWLFGKIVKGKIIVNQAVLGHELTHLLNFKDPKVANPDKLDGIGL